MKIYNNIRLPKENKNYWQNQFQMFADKFDEQEIKGVQFGKQDIRGTESITLIDLKDCVPAQIHFENKFALLGYVRGYNEAGQKDSCYLGRFIK